MNQILFCPNNNKYSKKFFIFLFYALITIIICLICFFLFYSNFLKKKEDVSSLLLNNYNLNRLYSTDNELVYVNLNEYGNFFVVGIIEIPKLDLKYPILSEVSQDLLKISPCRFYGPFPNQIGNLCIAAHNYDDDRFFGNIHRLNTGDVINIYDSNDNMVSYFVYDEYEIKENDFSCTSQSTDGKKEITLVTCNNITKNRFIVKAKEQQ